MKHPLFSIAEMKKSGRPAGICSVCSANRYVIEAAMEAAMRYDSDVLIEATANQVNQFGGYTGMNPFDFKDYVSAIALKTGFPFDRIILGGDHLGPLAWENEASASAMEKAAELIRQYVLSGFTKIHIDTSMLLGDDSPERKLDTGIIADRSAKLFFTAEQAFIELRKDEPDALHPVYVIGSEVPIPGGSRETEELEVTSADDFRETISSFFTSLKNYGLDDVWKNIIAIVVQPGVEFGDDWIHDYSRDAAQELCASLRDFPNFCFEGHSTDYQTAASLKMMIQDGISILKVGPALTYALRESLFMLSQIENELLAGAGSTVLSRFPEVLENAMLNNPENWLKHYHGSDEENRLARRYSYSDRIRYYLSYPEVNHSVEQLVSNLKQMQIPLGMISQFMPIQYRKIRNRLLQNDVESLIKDSIINVLDDYYFAVMPQDKILLV